MKKDFKVPETRYILLPLKIEKRAGEADTVNSRHIVGYALKFDSLSKDLGGFMERIDPNALDGVDMSDVVALFNHDKNMILARTSSETLTLTIDKEGLKYEFDAPETTAGNDLLISIGRGDIAGSSFAFCTGSDLWEQKGEMIIRTILKFERIVDVSPVVFPAYAETDVAQRGLDEFKTIAKKDAYDLSVSKTVVEMYRK